MSGAQSNATAMPTCALTSAPLTLRSHRPALNLTAQLPRDVFLRFSAGKVMSRPDYVGLTPSVSVNTTGQSVSIGNPNLDPMRADTFDLQGEWYYAKNAMVGLGLFRKNMKSFIQGASEQAIYSTLGIPNELLQTPTGCSITGGTPACPTTPDTLVTVSRQVNTSGGPLTELFSCRHVLAPVPVAMRTGSGRTSSIFFIWTASICSTRSQPPMPIMNPPAPDQILLLESTLASASAGPLTEDKRRLLAERGVTPDACCATLRAAGYLGWAFDHTPAAVRRAVYARDLSLSDLISRTDRAPEGDRAEQAGRVRGHVDIRCHRHISMLY